MKQTTNTQELATRIQTLMAEGKTMEEALEASLPKKGTRQVIDRIAFITSLSDIQALRKARKTAYAKKSKSKDKPETAAKYDKEIETASSRLNEVLAIVNSSETPWKTALEYGETPDGALQYLAQDMETATEAELTKLTEAMDPKPTKADIKVFCQGSTIIDTIVPEELREAFNRRIGNKDQRLYSMAQKAQALLDIKAGTRKLEAKAPTPKDEKPKETQETETPKAEGQPKDPKPENHKKDGKGGKKNHK